MPPQIITPNFNVTPIENPMDLAAKRLGIQQEQQKIAAGNLALRQSQQQTDDDQEIRAAAQRSAQAHSGNADPDEIQTFLDASNPRAAATWRKQLQDYRKTQQETYKAQLDNMKQHHELIGEIANGVTDQPTLQSARERYISEFGPIYRTRFGPTGDQAAAQEFDKEFGTTYDPKQIDRVKTSSMTMKDAMDLHQHALDNMDKAARLQIDTDKNTRDSQKADQENMKLWQQGIASFIYPLSFTPGTPQQKQQALTDAIAGIKKMYGGVPDSLIDSMTGNRVWSDDLPSRMLAFIEPEKLKALESYQALPKSSDEATKRINAIFADNPNLKPDEQKAWKAERDRFLAQLDAGQQSPHAFGQLISDAQKRADTIAAKQATAPTQINVAGAVDSAKNPLPDLSYITEQTKNGRSYIDQSKVTSSKLNQLQQQAGQAKVPVVSKDVADALREADTARLNLDYMMNTIQDKLPKDAAGRVIEGPVNLGKQLTQIDPELAAMGTFRNAAIQSMRAVAGSKGLRINRAEVQLAIDNDIPKPTDTVATARNKLKNLKAFLDNFETAHLGSGTNQAPKATKRWNPQTQQLEPIAQ